MLCAGVSDTAIGMRTYASGAGSPFRPSFCVAQTDAGEACRGLVPYGESMEYHILPREFALKTPVKIGSLIPCAVRRLRAASIKFRRSCVTQFIDHRRRSGRSFQGSPGPRKAVNA